MSTKPTVWRTPEVARYLRVSLSTVRRLVMERRIPFHKVGRAVLYFEHEIVSWLESK